MEEHKLEKLCAEFKGDSQIRDLIQTLKDAQIELEAAKSDCKKEEFKRKQAEELLISKQRKLLVCTLSAKLSKLRTDIQIEQEVCKAERT